MTRTRRALLASSLLSIATLPALAHDGPGAHEHAPTAQTSPDKTASKVTIALRGDYRYISSNGLPSHEPGQFPNRGNPNTIREQQYTLRVTLKPVAGEIATPVRMNLFGVALDGVVFDPGTNEFWNNDRQSGWRYEALSGKINLGLDNSNAHVQPTGAYHYHGTPTGLVTKLGGDTGKMLLIGYAADGFPIYTANGLSDPKNPTSPVRPMKSSYQLKPGTRPAGESSPGGNYDGTFVQDYQYTPGSGDLDECNGIFSITPEYPQGIYHYHVTTQFPFVARQFRGTPDPSFNRTPPGQGGRGGPGGQGGPGGGGPGGPGGGMGGPGGPGGGMGPGGGQGGGMGPGPGMGGNNSNNRSQGGPGMGGPGGGPPGGGPPGMNGQGQGQNQGRQRGGPPGGGPPGAGQGGQPGGGPPGGGPPPDDGQGPPPPR